MLYSERMVMPSQSNNNINTNTRHSNTNKYEYISDKINNLQNNSTSSSLSSNSSSSATNSSINTGSNTYIEPKYNVKTTKSINNPVYNLPRFSYLTLSPNLRRKKSNEHEQHSSQFKKCDLINEMPNKYDHQSLVQINTNKPNLLNDRLLSVQTKMSPHETKTINIGAQIRNKHNKQNPQTSSISYTYHTYNPNRLSSYDNDIYEYNNNNNNTVNHNKNDFDTSFLKTTNQRTSAALQSSIKNNNNSNNKQSSNIHLLKSCVNSNHSSNSKSSNNLFTRAFNYAFNKNKQMSSNTLDSKLTWKSKLGKLFPQSNNLSNIRNKSSSKHEGCDIALDEDLYESATYHLSRKQPIKKLNSNNLINSTCSPLSNENNNLLCLAANSSSVFSSKFDNTPYSSNNTNNTNTSQKKQNSSKKSKSKFLDKTSTSIANLNRSSPCLLKENSPPNSVKSNNLINSGFNSLRKILKISPTKVQKSNYKCSSASTTPVPPSSLKLNDLDNLKETKISNSPIPQIRCSMSSSNASLLALKQQQNRLDIDSMASKYSISKNGGINLTKSIINQTSSSFSSYSASLASCNDATSNKSKINIQDGNIDQIKKQVAFDDKKSQDALNQSKLDLSDNKSINTKIEEDKTKALKMLDYYKNSLKKNLSASDSLSNSKVKISSAEIFLTKNIQINDDSDYYDISKKTNENSNEQAHTSSTNNIHQPLLKTTTSSSSSSSKLKNVSSDEEILCDMEVASYFDDKKVKNSDEDSFYYEKDDEEDEENINNNNSDSKSRSSNNNDYLDDVLDDVIDDELDVDNDNEEEDDDEDSNNLEFLVRQLAAEATLSLSGKKINYEKNSKRIANNDFLYNKDAKPCILKNKTFMKFQASDEEELVYDLESNFGLNDFLNDGYNEVLAPKKNSSKSEIEEYDYDYNGSYSHKSDTSDSLNGVKMSSFNFNTLNGVKSSNSTNNNNNNNNKGFSSLRNKTKQNVYSIKPQQIYAVKKDSLDNNKDKNKRSSSTSSHCQQSHIVKLVNHQKPLTLQHPHHNHPNHYQNHQYLNHNQLQQNQRISINPRKENEFNSNIKIEKKIRLNYNRPQMNGILNFGTLC